MTGNMYCVYIISRNQQQQLVTTNILKMDSLKDFASGIISGWTQILVGQPFDYVKTNVQLSSQDVTLKSLRKIYQQTISQYGIMGFYRGTSSLIVGFAFTIGIEFTGYEACKKYFMDTRYKQSNKTPQQVLSMPQIILSGALVGLCVGFVNCPVQYAKIIKQTQQSKTKGSMKILFDQIIKGRLSKIYSGLVATQIRQILGLATYFSSYQASVRYLCRYKNKDRIDAKTKQFLLAGGIAGLLYWTVAYPFDVIKTQKQMGDSYKNILSEIRSNAFQGFGLMAVRSVICNCVGFTAFQYSKTFFKGLNDKNCKKN